MNQNTLNNQFDLDFQGVEVSGEFERFITHEIHHLLMDCPTSSYLNLQLVKVPGEIAGTMTIDSFAFSANHSCRGECLAEVITHLFETMKLKIRKWKFTRFMPKISS